MQIFVSFNEIFNHFSTADGLGTFGAAVGFGLGCVATCVSSIAESFLVLVGRIPFSIMFGLGSTVVILIFLGCKLIE